MFLMIVLGLFTTLIGVALASAVLELAMRALGHSLHERPVQRLLRPGAASRWPTEA